MNIIAPMTAAPRATFHSPPNSITHLLFIRIRLISWGISAGSSFAKVDNIGTALGSEGKRKLNGRNRIYPNPKKYHIPYANAIMLENKKTGK
jgi:hypothetical protein